MKAPTQQMMKTQLQGMLLELNLHTMAQVLDDQLSDPLYQEFSKLEFVHRIVQEEYVSRNNARSSQLLKRAGLWKTQADLEKIDYSIDRKLNRDLLAQLESCDFILDNKNLCILGAAGSGKSFFAKAFGVEACNRLHRTLYSNANTFLNKLHDLHLEDRKKYERKLRYFQRLPVLILDDWLMFSIHDQVRESILLDLIDARYGTALSQYGRTALLTKAIASCIVVLQRQPLIPSEMASLTVLFQCKLFSSHGPSVFCLFCW